MDTLKLFSLAIVLIVVNSCSSPDQSIIPILTIYRFSDDDISISNGSKRTIYLFVAEKSTAAVVDWTPHFEEPKVLPGEITVVEYTEIYNGQEEPVKEGDEIIIYYWTDEGKPHPEIHNLDIKL